MQPQLMESQNESNHNHKKTELQFSSVQFWFFSSLMNWTFKHQRVMVRSCHIGADKSTHMLCKCRMRKDRNCRQELKLKGEVGKEHRCYIPFCSSDLIHSTDSNLLPNSIFSFTYFVILFILAYFCLSFHTSYLLQVFTLGPNQIPDACTQVVYKHSYICL